MCAGGLLIAPIITGCTGLSAAGEPRAPEIHAAGDIRDCALGMDDSPDTWRTTVVCSVRFKAK